MKPLNGIYCFYPIMSFELKESIDIIQYVNIFILMYYLFLP